ncbi:hypothetical protein VKT23_011529 [Stygiomarasmius scandens]|uniref:Phospholipid/glycerol acyltransferase domain-containing protein n=1 Tax=Marasmiellus scandens TaxID=2682957 RepID=A0ABR1JCK4_9AGAR
MVELKLVYRFLRKVSDWTTSSYYSDVLVVGADHIPKDHPIIIASTHHNEMIDIATLAATVPYRRYLSFWAKASMFGNPVTYFVMTSVGAIPVKRNPNREPAATSAATTQGAQSQSSLFQSTSETLASNGIVGVFVEGTSYTQPKIVQVMSGAAWAAVEFLRWQGQHGEGKELLVIPVGIVYTDKSKYQSRIRIEYGQPIPLSSYKHQLSTETVPDADIVKDLTAHISDSLFQITINAEDWETLYSANIARQIMWGDDDRVPLGEWVGVEQSLISLLTPTSDEETESLVRVKRSLTKYFSLLHHANISHSTLERILPLRWPDPASSLYPYHPSNSNFNFSFSLSDAPPPIPPTLPSNPGRSYILKTLLRTSFRPTSTLKMLLQVTLILPTLPMYIPAYASSHLITRLLATHGEEEGIAQFMGVGGGIGRVACWWGWYGWKVLSFLENTVERYGGIGGILARIPYVGSTLGNLSSSPSLSSPFYTTLGRYLPLPFLSKIILLAILDQVFVSWYKLLIPSVYRHWKALTASVRLRLLWALINPGSWSWRRSPGNAKRDASAALERLERYAVPPPPPENAFIRRRNQKQNQREEKAKESSSDSDPGSGSVSGLSSLASSMVGSLQTSNISSISTSRLNSGAAAPPPPVPITHLITPLLYAREEAKVELGRFLMRFKGRGFENGEKGSLDRATKVEWLMSLGGKVPRY